MDSFEWNKIFAALLTVAFVLMGTSILSDIAFNSHAPEKPGFAIEGGEAHAETPKAAGPVTVESVNALLASADVVKGEKVAKKCGSCHNFNDGGKNKTGPALYGIVDRPMASVDGFGYSSALKSYGADKKWTYEELNGFLYKPKTHIKGTSMGFSGVKKTADRAALIGYLRSLAATPVALPEG